METINVLLLLASPIDMDALQVMKEARFIKDTLKKSKLNKRINLIIEPSADIDAVVDSIKDNAIDILHFSGHSDAERIVMESKDNTNRIMSIASIEALFSTDKAQTIKLLVLNSCNSANIAKTISEQCGILAIGTNDKILDRVAIDFSTGFYVGIGEHGLENIRETLNYARIYVPNGIIAYENGKPINSQLKLSNSDEKTLILIAALTFNSEEKKFKKFFMYDIVKTIESVLAKTTTFNENNDEDRAKLFFKKMSLDGAINLLNGYLNNNNNNQENKFIQNFVNLRLMKKIDDGIYKIDTEEFINLFKRKLNAHSKNLDDLIYDMNKKTKTDNEVSSILEEISLKPLVPLAESLINFIEYYEIQVDTDEFVELKYNIDAINARSGLWINFMNFLNDKVKSIFITKE